MVIVKNADRFDEAKDVFPIYITMLGVRCIVLEEYKFMYLESPAELLQKLELVAEENKISTHSREWPREQKWLVRRINVIKPNLQQELGIEIRIERNPKNTSLIKIEKNDSGVSGKHKMTPENESLTPYLEEMSPEKDRMSPVNQDYASRKSNSSGDTGHTGVISHMSKEEVDKTADIKKNAGSDIDQMIGYREPFWYCKQHPKVQKHTPRGDRAPYSIFQRAYWKIKTNGDDNTYFYLPLLTWNISFRLTAEPPWLWTTANYIYSITNGSSRQSMPCCRHRGFNGPFVVCGIVFFVVAECAIPINIIT